jgi:acetylornithine/succinyldiaminopimelate/putrescine aminotransferase
MVCLGKGLAGGLPVGATLVSAAVSARIFRGIHTSTFGGNPLVGAGILATLDLLDDAILAGIHTLGSYFLDKMKTLRSDIISQVKGRGMMLGLEVGGQRDLILKRLQEAGILAVPAGENVVRFLPPYLLTRKLVDEVVKTLQKVLKEAACAAF